MTNKTWILLPLFFLLFYSASGQEGEKKKPVNQPDTAVVMGKGKILYKGHIYRENAPYLTFGYGAGYGFEARKIEQNMTLSFQYFIKKLGLQVGYHSSSDTKIWWRSYQKLNDLFLGVGRRWERTRYNFAVFGAPSLAYGSYIAWNPDVQKDFAYGFTTLGFHAEALATYKLTYDIGVGLSLYGSVNRYYSAAGAQIHLFFSTAFVRNYD